MQHLRGFPKEGASGSVKDQFGRMTLLLGISFIALDDLSNLIKERANLWSRTGLA
jgi:hypothetical protein